MKLLLSVLLFQPFVFAARTPPAIAIHAQTKRCLMYWPGEPRTPSVLPKGWEGWTALGKVKTTHGECEFRNEPGDVEACCKSLGFEYVPAKDSLKVLRSTKS